MCFYFQWHFVSGMRLAQCQENAFAIVNAGMSVKFEDGTDTIKDLQMFYGSVGPTVVSASQTCKQLIGRYVIAHPERETQTFLFYYFNENKTWKFFF